MCNTFKERVTQRVSHLRPFMSFYVPFLSNLYDSRRKLNLAFNL